MSSVISEKASKAKATILCASLASMGVDIKHSRGLELIAHIEGFKNWSTLNAQQAAAALVQEAPAAKFVLVGAENLLPGHIQSDSARVNCFGQNRVSELYCALRTSGIPYVYHEHIVEGFMQLGGFSCPPKELQVPAPGDDTEYEDDATPCNVKGQTRLEVLNAVLDRLDADPFEGLAFVDEFRARGGLTRIFSES